MSEFLDGKVVAITGAGGGIGRAVALAAAAEGAKVVVADIGVGLAGEDPTSEVAEAVVKEIEAAGGEAVAVAESVTTLAGGEQIIGAGVERWGRIDGVVAVAGILRERMLFNMSEDEWDAVIETHLKGHFTVFRAASAIMRKQEGGARWSPSPPAPSPAAWPRPTTPRPRAGSSRWCARPPPGSTATASRPTPSPRWPAPGCRPTSPWTWPRWATPRTWPPWSSTCCRTRPST